MSDVDDQLLQGLQAAKGAGAAPPDASAIDAQIAAGLSAARGAPTSAMSAFKRGAASGFADNFLGLPDLAVQAGDRALKSASPLYRVADPVDIARKVMGKLTGGAVQLPTEIGQRTPGFPTGDQAVAAASALTSDQPGGLVDRFKTEMARGQQMQEEHPIASGAGEVAGDVGTLMTGRLPLRASIANAEKLIQGINTAKGLNPGMWRIVNEAVSSHTAKSIYQGLFRAGETGLEGASLAVLKQGDPMTVGAFSAGGQLAGSTALSLGSHAWGHGLGGFGTRVLGAAAAGAAVARLAYEYTPLGEGNIFDTLQAFDGSFKHIAMALGLGVGAGMLGAGRMRSARLYQDIPKIIDGVTAAPRGAVMSIATDITKRLQAGQQDAARALTHLVNDPNAFNETQLKQLGNAVLNGRFGATVDKLLKTDPRFVDTIDSDPVPIDTGAGDDNRRQDFRSY
jgi:hypothetical protein